MLSKEILKAHYREYSNQKNSWVENMAKTKLSILKQVFREIFFEPKGPVNIAVLGASDKRYIVIHERIFRELFGKDISLVTFDIDTDHLGKLPGTILHDVTLPFPYGPYDVVFSHALMKFLTHDEQLKVIKNSFNALKDNGVSMHIMHSPELTGTKELRVWQQRVDLDLILQKLRENTIKVKILQFKSESLVDWLRDTTVLIAQKTLIT